MRRIFLAIPILILFCSAVRSQDVPRPPTERDYAAMRERNTRPVNDNNNWPTRPTVSTSGKPYYTSLEAKFAVTNDSSRKIERVTWQCILLHPDTNHEIAKYIIVTKKKIAPHQGAILKKRVAVPLKDFYGPKVVPVGQTSEPPKKVPDEIKTKQVNTILEIKYTDGTVEHP